MLKRFFNIFLLPGIVFQSIVIGAGYGTGQELIQYFLSLGPRAGLLGLLTTLVVWSTICALTFVLAYQLKAYDYKAFIKGLLGPGWVLFEICFIYLIVLVTSVICVSIGHMLKELLNIPVFLGIVLPLIYIFFMASRASKTIEKIFSIWSLLLYIVFFALFVYCLSRSETNPITLLKTPAESLAWLKNGVLYACYNLAVLPALLFCLHNIENKKQAMGAGLLSGVIAIIPGVLFYFALLTDFENVLGTMIPSTVLLDKLGIKILTISFAIVLIGTLLETGVGLMHAFHKRITATLAGKTQHYNKIQKACTLTLLLFALAFSQFGLIGLIAKGYSALSILMLFVFIGPLLTIGVRRIIKGLQPPPTVISKNDGTG